MEPVRIPDFFEVGPNRPFLLIGGPCVIESAALCREVAAGLKEICGRLGISYMFKASFDKANRTSLDSFRGPGLDDRRIRRCHTRQRERTHPAVARGKPAGAPPAIPPRGPRLR